MMVLWIHIIAILLIIDVGRAVSPGSKVHYKINGQSENTGWTVTMVSSTYDWTTGVYASGIKMNYRISTT